MGSSNWGLDWRNRAKIGLGGREGRSLLLDRALRVRHGRKDSCNCRNVLKNGMSMRQTHKNLIQARAFISSSLQCPSATPQSLGSIYIRRITLREFQFIRRSTRIASVSSHSNPQFRSSLGTYHDSSHTPTPEQGAEIVIGCPEIKSDRKP